MRVENPWAKHSQMFWEEKAGDPRLPAWVRVSALAFGKHKPNGHAVLSRGYAGLILGSVDDDGVLHPHANVTRAIKTAVEYGWLHPASRARCLVVPTDITGGIGGSEFTKCPIHDRPSAASVRRLHAA